jgi:hypothetical protein
MSKRKHSSTVLPVPNARLNKAHQTSGLEALYDETIAAKSRAELSGDLKKTTRAHGEALLKNFDLSDQIMEQENKRRAGVNARITGKQKGFVSQKNAVKSIYDAFKQKHNRHPTLKREMVPALDDQYPDLLYIKDTTLKYWLQKLNNGEDI